jgi:hypothetical protein
MEITPSRIGFVATHFNGTDRVSLESKVWHEVLTEMGHECFFFAGDSSQPEERTVIVPEADFKNQDIDLLNQEIYQNGKRSSKTSGTIQALRFHIKQHLHQFIQIFDINLLVVENALSFPLNIPLGLALTEVIAETGITCLGRHHDFAWEYLRYVPSPATDYTLSNFPPALPTLQHIVSTRYHANELAARAGVNARVIPYARDFHRPDVAGSSSANEFLQGFGISPGALLAISTSPISPVSRLETALAMIARMDQKPEFVLCSHSPPGDQRYLKYIMETAELLQSPVHLVAESMQTASKDEDTFESQMTEFFQNAHFVISLGTIQGAAAEASEAIYRGRPLVTTAYNPALRDLKARGFQFIEIPIHPDLEAVRTLETSLHTPERIAEMIDQNLALGRQLLSLDILSQRLAEILLETLTP